MGAATKLGEKPGGEGEEGCAELRTGNNKNLFTDVRIKRG